MVKVVSLFLIAILALGMFGKLRLPGTRKRRGIKTARKCPSCGAYLIGDGPCKCKQS